MLHFSRRFLHITVSSSAVARASLAELRKRTGYAFTSCKKALELHSDDLQKAEEWLHAEAKKEGWIKAAKAQERRAAEGLIGVCSQHNAAAMVEVNCETDFVSRNAQFQEFVGRVASSCCDHASQKTMSEKLSQAWYLSGEEIGGLHADGNTLGDTLALMAGQLGESLRFTRCTCLQVKDGVSLVGHTHPAVILSDQSRQCSVGKYGAVVAFQYYTPVTDATSAQEFGRKLCQQVIGHNPLSMGSLEDFLQKYQSSLSEEPTATSGEETRGQTSDDDETSASEESDDGETRLLFQEFLPETEAKIKVYTALQREGVEMVGFSRLKCGEDARDAD